MTSRMRNYLKDETARIRSLNQRNWRIFKEQPWQEMSGAFGDLGTFVPIFVALAASSRYEEISISVSNTLVFSGLANILTGIFFGIPLPVQPMKAIAAVAIANMNTPEVFGAAELASAGLFVAGCVALLSATGLLQVFTKAIPVPVVKGIQMGAGLTLAMKSIAIVYDSVGPIPGLRWWDGPLSITSSAVLLVTLLYVGMLPRFPLTLIVVAGFAILATIGGIVLLITDQYYYPHQPWFSLWNPLPLIIPAEHEFVRGALEAGLGQLPLTTLNSIVAVVYLADDLFPDLKAPTATAIGSSVALMNLVGCWFRAMPVCHGSGGLAAQYRFGARSGSSVIFLGALKLVLGLFGSEFALEFCREFPGLVLAVLLFLAGLELVKMGESINSEQARDLWEDSDEEESLAAAASSGGHGDGDDDAASMGRRFAKPDMERRTRRWTVMSATIIALLGAKNDGVGFVVGMLVHGIYNAQDWYARRWQNREGQIRLDDEDEARTGSVEPSG